MVIHHTTFNRDFNPLPPCGGRPHHSAPRRATRRFQSTPSVWRETQCAAAALHTGTISIHSLRVEGDLRSRVRARQINQFQSTPSVWRETIRRSAGGIVRSDFNPLPPCGGRLDTVSKIADHVQFQSTPSVWRETSRDGHSQRERTFQSTPSVWRETAARRRA